MSQQYRILVSGSAPVLYPTDTFFGLLYYNRNEALEIPKRYPYSGDWGKPLSRHLLEREQYPIPGLLDMVWLSITERRFYSIMKRLPDEQIAALFGQKGEESGETVYEHIIVGMAPYGGVAVWIHGDRKSSLVNWYQAEPIKVDMKDFMPLNPTVTLKENCEFYINNDSRVKENLKKNGLPPRDLFDNYMKQFTYRYDVRFGQWDEKKKEWCLDGQSSETEPAVDTRHPAPEFDYIEEELFDGTHDKLHDGGLMNHHEAGKPKKLAVRWHVKKKEWTAYFWFEDEEIRHVFDRFYGAHPGTKTDLIIRVDQEKNHFELALYRYGLREAQVIPEQVYQLIVFKNNLECFRSKNYAQERGAWIW